MMKVPVVPFRCCFRQICSLSYLLPGHYTPSSQCIVIIVTTARLQRVCNPTCKSRKGAAVQHPDGRYTRAQGVRSEALPRGLFQRRGPVLLVFQQRSGGTELGMMYRVIHQYGMHFQRVLLVASPIDKWRMFAPRLSNQVLRRKTSYLFFVSLPCCAWPIKVVLATSACRHMPCTVCRLAS